MFRDLSQIKARTDRGDSFASKRVDMIFGTAVTLFGVGSMTGKTGVFLLIGRRIGLLAILLLLAPVTSADCAKDSYGEVYCGGGRCLNDLNGNVWCSRHYKGGAEKTQDGRILCGKGECAKDSRGQIFCSSVVGGSVLKDSRGHVRCYGRCEPASTAQCENTPADSGG